MLSDLPWCWDLKNKAQSLAINLLAVNLKTHIHPFGSMPFFCCLLIQRFIIELGIQHQLRECFMWYDSASTVDKKKTQHNEASAVFSVSHSYNYWECCNHFLEKIYWKFMNRRTVAIKCIIHFLSSIWVHESLTSPSTH